MNHKRLVTIRVLLVFTFIFLIYTLFIDLKYFFYDARIYDNFYASSLKNGNYYEIDPILVASDNIKYQGVINLDNYKCYLQLTYYDEEGNATYKSIKKNLDNSYTNDINVYVKYLNSDKGSNDYFFYLEDFVRILYYLLDDDTERHDFDDGLMTNKENGELHLKETLKYLELTH